VDIRPGMIAVCGISAIFIPCAGYDRITGGVEAMENIEFSVKDMDCKSCVNVILKKLKAFEGVKDVKIDLATKKVKVEWENPNVCDSDLTCAVEDLGYKVSMD
jgi:copper chaperone CopZ